MLIVNLQGSTEKSKDNKVLKFVNSGEQST